MPIIIPENLPARQTLEQERIRVITEGDAIRQDVRPLQIGLLNLMPEKVKTERMITRLVGATPLQVEMTLITTGSYQPKNTSGAHMLAFYQAWDDVKDRKFDGFIVTGAPIETLPFDDVIYWDEMTRIFDWTLNNVHSTLNICWGGQAALNHFHGVPKHDLPEKMFGVFPHRIVAANTHILRGFNDVFLVPVSRHTEVRREDIPDVEGLNIVAESDLAGLCLLEDTTNRQVFMFNHLEYEAATLGDEYHRDVAAGMDIKLPYGYFPNDDPEQKPVNNWRASGHLLFSNWINQVYQTTYYNIDRIGEY
jgi:homoserine O-succinyltransferase